MSKTEQLIAIHIGQAGIQMGSAFWELICIEQGITPDGSPLVSDDTSSNYDSASSLCDLGNTRNYIPRAIFIDSEPNVIDDIKTGVYRNLFPKSLMLNTFEDSGNNYARGAYTIGKQMINTIVNRIRKTVEPMDNLVNFLLFNSNGGGTGSGLSPLIFLSLMKDYPKISRSAISIVPGNNLVSAVVEPYNYILQNFGTIETADINFLFENESIFDICCKRLLFNSPSFTELNRILALIVSSITSPMRFSSTLHSSMSDMLINLIPYPRIHFPLVRYAPINHMSRTTYDKITTADLTNELFSKDNQSMKIDTNKGRYIALNINYQGMVNPSEIFKSIDRQKINNPKRFVEWSPTGFKVGICNQIPSLTPMSEMSQTDQSATMLLNTTSIKEFFVKQMRKFDLLYERRSFVHWFVGEGMEETEFSDAKTETKILVGDFNEIGMTEKEIIESLKMGNNKTSRSISVRQPVNDDDLKFK